MVSRQLRAFPQLRSVVERAESRLSRSLVLAGWPLGLSTHETLFLSLLLALAGMALGLVFAEQAQRPLWAACGAALGLGLVPIRLRSLASERQLVISHELPAVIDLTSLAMSAGADFTSALRRIAETRRGPLGDELRLILLSLEMGVTRSQALLEFEERCPVDEVRDLVRAVVMAERKGASLREALSQQAESSRQRRSIRAEEAAARAGVQLIFPVMLLVTALFLILVGPLFCRVNLSTF